MERIKQKLNEARKQREKIQQGYVTSTHAEHGRHSGIPKKDVTTGPIDNNTRLLAVAAAVIIPLAMLIWWGGTENEPQLERLSDIEIYESRQAIGAMSTTVEMMNNKIVSLAAQMDSLSESITQLETKLISTQMSMNAVVANKAQPTEYVDDKQETIFNAINELDTLPPPASGQSDIETTSEILPQPSSARVSPEPSTAPAKLENQRTVEHEQPTINTDKSGPWVINLVSTSSKDDADRLSKKAHSKDIPTEQQQITVKGTQYWRVQVTGFSTADDARAYADTAKEQLGLKDAWIMKR
jgi:cell division septation protein DedD